MGETANRVHDIHVHFSKDGFEDKVFKALVYIAGAIDNLTEKQNFQKSSEAKFESRKTTALIIVIEKIIVLYQNEYFGKANSEEVFKLFEKTKAIKRAENETEFQSAIADL